MKVVLDVGQFVSATMRADGHPGQVLSFWRQGAFELVTSRPILADLGRVLRYPRVRRRNRWTDEQIEEFLVTLGSAATMTPGGGDPVTAVQEDPSDNKILACAGEASVDYIVASDEHITKLGTYLGIPIVRPRAFLEIVGAFQPHLDPETP